MKVRFQADNDLRRDIVTATLRRERKIDFKTAQDAGLEGLDDEQVLARAAAEGRVLVTHDKRTMRHHLEQFLRAGHRSPGVLVVVPQDAPLILVVDSLELIWAASEPEEWENVMTFIPL